MGLLRRKVLRISVCFGLWGHLLPYKGMLSLIRNSPRFCVLLPLNASHVSRFFFGVYI